MSLVKFDHRTIFNLPPLNITLYVAVFFEYYCIELVIQAAITMHTHYKVNTSLSFHSNRFKSSISSTDELNFNYCTLYCHVSRFTLLYRSQQRIIYYNTVFEHANIVATRWIIQRKKIVKSYHTMARRCLLMIRKKKKKKITTCFINNN